MELLFVFAYFLGIFALILIGNGLFSVITIRKTIKISFLETLGISLGLGIIFIILYGYLVDFVVNSFGLIQFTQFLIFVLIPIGIGIILKLFSIKIKIGKQSSLLSTLHIQLKEVYPKVKDFVNHYINKFRNPGDRKSNYLKLILGFCIIFVMLFKIFVTFDSSSAQFSFDPYIWMNVIINYANHLTINYDVVQAYPAGTYILDAFFTQFLFSSIYSTQYLFLKWLPFLNLFIFYFLLYLIVQRLFKNKLYFFLIFLFTFDRYFFYRITILLPSPLVVTFLELIVLISLIPDVPQYLIYLAVGTSLMAHPVSGIFLISLFLTYKMIVGLKQLYGILKTKKHLKERENRINQPKLWKILLSNIFVFLIPIVILVLSLTFRFTPSWFINYQWYLTQSTISTIPNFYTSSYAIPLVFADSFSIFNVVDWPILLGKINWLAIYHNPLFLINLIFVFIPQKWYMDSDSQEKNKLVLFLRYSILITIFIFIIQSLTFLHDLIDLIPYGSVITNIFWSDFYSWTSVRIFEVTCVLDALFLGFAFKKIIEKIEKFLLKRNTKKSHFNLKKETNSGILSSNLSNTQERQISTTQIVTVVILASVFIYNAVFFVPSYTYYYKSDTIDGFLWFRDHLDNTTSGINVVGFNSEDTNLPKLIGIFLPRGNNYTQLNYNITVSGINLNFTSNPVNEFEYLFISFDNMDNSIAEQIRTTYYDSASDIFHNNWVLILKFG